ncbi:MAG TPA: tetratricopeptide repeat protein [Treponemataceae bacterium]|nr:tetratricopeptide repeat protein [Treponemataceae bacterium]
MANKLKEGISLYKNRQYTESLTAFLSVPSGIPENNLELAYYIGLCYARLDRNDDSLVYLEQVVTADTDLARVFQCRLLLAVIYTRTGRMRLADFELRKIIDSGYESVQVFCSLGYIAYEHGDIEAAIEWYDKSLSLDPSNATALNGLGYVLADTGKDLTRALTFCKKAVDADHENPAYLDSLGWVYYKLGLFPEAKTHTRRAKEYAPNNKIIVGHLDDIIKAIFSGNGG